MRSRLAPRLLALAIAGGACAPVVVTPSPSPTISSSASPTSATTASAAPTPSATPSPTRTPAPSGTRTPGAVPSFAQSDLVARVDLQGDTAGGFTTVVVSVDGTYVTTSADWVADRSVRRLTPEGIGLVRDRIAATGLFTADASYGLILKPGAQPPGHGASGVQISVWSGTRVVHVSSTLLIAGDERYYDLAPEGVTLAALAQALRAPETWLPPTAWRDAVPQPYVAPYYRVVTGGAQAIGPEAPFDMTFVAWPFTKPLGSFGDIVVPSGQVMLVGPAQIWFVDGPVRCAVLRRDDALLIRDALFAARAPIWTGNDAFAVQGIVDGRTVAFIAQPMLPASMFCAQDQF